jgi:hypothetical protein
MGGVTSTFFLLVTVTLRQAGQAKIDRDQVYAFCKRAIKTLFNQDLE